MQIDKSKFREKEDKIDHDFSKLLDRYNRSKMVIDQLYHSNQSTNQKQDTTFKSETLKQQTKDKEHKDGLVSRDKYSKVRNLNKELKLTLKEYIERTKLLDIAVQDKDEVIFNMEKELRENQDNLYKNMQEQKEMAYKEDHHARIVEELKQQVSILKAKILKKKGKVQMLKESQKNMDYKLDDQTNDFKQELERVQKLCEEFSIEIKEQEKQNYLLKEENDVIKQALHQSEEQCRYYELSHQDDKQQANHLTQKLQELQEDKKVSTVQFDSLHKKIADLEDQLKQSEHRHNIQLAKLEQDKNNITLDFETQLESKKDKNKQLKQQVQNLDSRITQFSKEELQMSKYVQDLKQESAKLQQLLDEQKQKTDQANNETAQKINQLLDLQQELQGHLQKLQQQDEKLIQYDIQYHMDQKEKNKLLQELDIINEENQRLQNILYDTDREFAYMRQQQEDEIIHIEKKVDSLVQELQASKEECLDQRQKCNDLKKSLISQEDQTNQFKGKYLKQKQINKTYEQEQKFMEEKVRLLENERILEEREALKHKDIIVQQKQTQQTKIKVLDEIQNMIKLHKKKD